MDEFVSKALLVQAKRRVPVLSKRETELLKTINESLSETEWTRFYELVAKRKSENISADELGELIVLTDKLETLNVKRLECVQELSQIGQIPFEKLFRQLGLNKGINVI